MDSSYLLVKAHFRLRCEVPPASEVLRRLLEPLQVEPAVDTHRGNVLTLRAAGKGFELRRGSDPIRSARSWEPLVVAAIEEMNRSALANFDGFACHAGVTALGPVALAFPAPSEGGKSTLTAAFTLHGFDYVSDEALCLDLGTGELVGYPKPIGLSAWSRSHLGVTDHHAGFVQAKQMGGEVAAGRLEIGHILLIERTPGVASLHEIPRAQIVAALLQNSFNHYKHPAESFKLVTEIAAHARGWKLVYDSALDAAELVRARLFG